MLDKPASVAADPFKSAKWDELSGGRGLRPSDAPTLAMLVQWHAVAQRCIDDLDEIGQVAYQNNLGDVKALPQIATLKQASAEIRALNKQLGINDAAGEPAKPTRKTKLYAIQSNREKRRSKAANTA